MFQVPSFTFQVSRFPEGESPIPYGAGKFQKDRGFTLIEMLVVISIIAILSSMVFFNYKTGKNQLALERTARKLVQDIRKVQLMAGLKKKDCPEHPNYKYGYGISLSKANKTYYILFADCDGNEIYTGQDKKLGSEYILFEQAVEIKNLYYDYSHSTNNLDIVFEPPDPVVFINSNKEEGEITIGLESGTEKTIFVNKFGLIDIE